MWLNPNVVSSIALVIFLYGRSQVKKNLNLHKWLMATAMSIDVALIATLTIKRDAVGTVASGEMSTLLWIHVPIAISTVIGYVFAVYFVTRIMKGQRRYLKHIRIADKIIVPLRILTTITSLMLYFLK